MGTLFAKEKWSDQLCDRNFNNAWGDSSPLELGRVMPNECWLRYEAPLTKSEVDPWAVTLSSTELGPMRRDPRGLSVREATSTKVRSTSPVPSYSCPARERKNLQSASAMGSSVASEQALFWAPRDAHAPRLSHASVALLGVTAVMRLAHTNRASRPEPRSHLRGPKKPTVSIRASERAPHATVGDGCPGGVLFKSAARSSQRGNGWPC